MRIVVLGKQVAPVHNDAVKHVLRRLMDLDGGVRVAAPFLEELSRPYMPRQTFPMSISLWS